MHSALIVPLTFVIATSALTACQSGSASSAPSPSAASSVSFAMERTATIWVKGMPCPFCASNLETYIAKIDGIEKVDADLATGRVLVQVTRVEADTEAVLRKAVDDSGFSIDTIELPR